MQLKTEQLKQNIFKSLRIYRFSQTEIENAVIKRRKFKALQYYSKVKKSVYIA